MPLAFKQKDYVLIALYALALFYGLSFWTRPIHDPDLGWQLAGGAWIIKHGRVPQYDFINSFASHWHDYHWLSQLVLYKIYQWGGFELLRCFLGFTLAAIFILLLDIGRISIGRKNSNLILTLFFVSSSLLISFVTSVRPQMLALLLLCIALRLLIQKPKKWELAILILLTLLLVNMHVYWVFVPYLWFIYRMLPKIVRSKKCDPKDLAKLGILVLCALGSPYSYENYLLIWEYFNLAPFLKGSIGEFRSSFALSGYAPWIIFVYLIVVARCFRLSRFLAKPGHGINALLGPLLAFRSIKFISIFSLFSLPFVIRNAGIKLKPYAPSVFKRDILVTKLLIYGLSIFALVAAVSGMPYLNAKKTDLDKNYPFTACSQATKQKVRPATGREHIRVLTHFNHGGWCYWALSQADPYRNYKVTTDGRTQNLPVDHFKKSADLFALRPSWLKTLDEWNPDLAVVAKEHPLAQGLSLLEEWEEVFRDEVFVLFRAR